MKIKVSIFNKALLRNYLVVLSIINIFTSFFFIFVSIPNKYKIYIGISFFLVLIIIYFGMWIHANCLKCSKFTINNSNVTVKVGDIFQEEGLKVIAFNEYFDTVVDEEIIASSTLNGKFIKQYVNNIDELDQKISKSSHLSSQKLENNTNRNRGKTQKYKLGSIFKYNDYLLTAFSKFDTDNRAFLTMVDYINCLVHFWDEVDIIYADRSIVIPLLGTGITRLKNYDSMSEQEKLELLLWSFKLSRIKFTYPAKVTIVVYKPLKDKINFYKLKEIV